MNKKLTFEELNIKLVESVGLVVDESGAILTAAGVNLTKNGLNIVIPTKANLSNQNEIVDGKIKPKYTMFNPYSEDELKRNQILVILMKYMSAISTSGIVDGVLRQIIELLSKDEVQDTVSTHVKNFIIKLREINGNRGVLMSKKRISEINKITDYLLENNLFLIDYKLSKGEIINGIKYNRLAKLNPTAIEKVESDYEIIGVDVKTKDIFIAIIDFIIPGLADKVVGSTSIRYPSSTAAINIYNEVQGRINFLLKDMDEVIKEVYEELHMPLLDIVELDSYKSDIEFLPNQNELDSNRISVETKKTNNTMSMLQERMSNYGSIKEADNHNSISYDNNVPHNTFPVVEEELDPVDSFKASLYGGKQDHGFINRHNTQIHYNFNPNTNVQAPNGYFNQNINNNQSAFGGNSFSNFNQNNGNTFSNFGTNNSVWS